MSRQQMLLLGIAVSLLVFFLVGCGGNPPAAVSEVPKATSAPEQSAATPEPPTATSVPPTATPIPPTPTPKPPTATPVPPTATPVPPTPTPEPPTATSTPAVVNPQPGATFSGDLKSDEVTGSGVINFKVSNDGNSISEGEIKLTGASLKPIECSGGSLEGMSELTQSLKGPFPVKDGNINASLAEGGELKGAFTSPTEANGTIKVVVNITIFSNSIICDFGTWEWSAKASASTSDTATSATINPQPGATLSGAVEDNENVSGAIVNLELSADGTSITTVTVGLTGPGKCGDVTLGEGSILNSFISGPFPVTEDGFDVSLPNGGQLNGKFISPTEASGTITVMGLDYVSSCKFGPLNWSAKASASTSEQSSSDATTGQVKGILIDQDSQQPIGEVSAFLAGVAEGGGFSISEESPAVETNKAGEFTFEEVPPGKYALISGTKSPERNDKGKIVVASRMTPLMRDNKDEVIIIEVVEGEVIDLGKVLTVSSEFP